MSEHIPMTGLKNCVWTLEHRQTEQFGRGGGSQSIKLGNPFWRVRFEFENMLDADFRALTAFLARREGSRVPFWASRPDRDLGINYTSGVTASVTVSGIQPTLDANQNQNLELGDMVGYNDVNGNRFVGEVTVIVSNGSNGITTVETQPPAPPRHATRTEGLVQGAYGDFTLEPESLNTS